LEGAETNKEPTITLRSGPRGGVQQSRSKKRGQGGDRETFKGPQEKKTKKTSFARRHKWGLAARQVNRLGAGTTGDRRRRPQQETRTNISRNCERLPRVSNKPTGTRSLSEVKRMGGSSQGGGTNGAVDPKVICSTKKGKR